MTEDTNGQARSHWPIAILSTLASGINIFLPLFLVRHLSSEDMGSLKLFFFYLALVPAFTFSSGIMSGLGYWSGRDTTRSALRASFFWLLLVAGTSAGILTCFSAPITSSLGFSQTHLLLFIVALSASIISSFFEEAAIASGYIWLGAGFYSGFEVVRACSMLIAAWWTGSVAYVYLAYVLVVSVKCLLGTILGVQRGLIGVQFDLKWLRSVWQYSFPVSMAWLFGVFIDNPDQLALSFLVHKEALSKSDFALYALGCLTLPPLFTYEHSVARVLIPLLSEALDKAQIKEAKRLYSDAIANLSIILIPATIGLVVYSTPIVTLLFTSRYSAGASYLSLYAVTYLLLVIPYDAVARGKGDTKWIFRTFMCCGLGALIGTLLLAEFFGPMGALVGLILGKAVLRMLGLRYAASVFQTSIAAIIPWRRVSSSLLACGPCVAVALLTRSLFPSDQWWLIGSGSLFLVLYFALLLQLEIFLIGIASSSHNRVVVVVQSLNPGGIERCVANLVEGLHHTGLGNARVVAYDHAQSDSPVLIDRMRSQGIVVTAYKKRGGFSFRTVVTLIGCALQDGVMNFHTHDIGGLMYASCVKLLTLGRARIVHTQHSFIHLAKNSRYVWYERFFTLFATHVCAVSEEVADQYRTYAIRRQRPTVIYNGVQFLAEPSSAPSRDARLALLESHSATRQVKPSTQFLDGTWVLYLARVHPGKGQRELLSIWKHLPEATRERCHLLIVGPASDAAEQAAVEALARQEDLTGSVHFMGASSNPELWLQQTDCFVSYSLAEGLPLAPLEAAGAGLVTILSEIRGHEFLLEHADYLPLYAPEAAAGILEGILSSVTQCSLGTWQKRYENRSALRESFSLNRMLDEYSHLYWKKVACSNDA